MGNNAMQHPKERFAGEVAKDLGIGVQTLHYYEREGLIPAPRRSESGYRIYDAALVDRVRFIRKAQSLGLTLENVREIIQLSDRGACPCGHVHAALTARLQEVDERLKQLRSFRSDLATLVSRAHAVTLAAKRSRSTNNCSQLCEIVEQANATDPAGHRLLPLTRRPRSKGRAS